MAINPLVPGALVLDRTQGVQETHRTAALLERSLDAGPVHVRAQIWTVCEVVVFLVTTSN